MFSCQFIVLNNKNLSIFLGDASLLEMVFHLLEIKKVQVCLLSQ